MGWAWPSDSRVLAKAPAKSAEKSQNGLGENSIALYSAKYCIDREFFKDGAFILNAKKSITN